MKTIKRNFIWGILLCSVVVFGQKQTKKVNDSFKVNKDVLVEINTRHSDVSVETWNKNTVDIKGVWEIEGMTKEEAAKYFKGWDFEALGNKNKVVIKSRSSNNYHNHYDVFDDMDFDFDFDMESISYIGEVFNGDYYSDLLRMPAMTPMPPIAPMPQIPVPVADGLKDLHFDYEAYQKDKEGYMKAFEESQQAWEKEFEEKFEPLLKAYEKQIEEWQKKMEPQMKAFEEKMKEWEKEVAPKLEEYEKKMEKKMKIMEKEMEKKYVQKLKEKEEKIAKYKIKKNFFIKVPVGATIKVDVRYGKITLPDHIKTID